MCVFLLTIAEGVVHCIQSKAILCPYLLLLLWFLQRLLTGARKNRFVKED
jgi:hypothetical protein